MSWVLCPCLGGGEGEGGGEGDSRIVSESIMYHESCMATMWRSWEYFLVRTI